MLEIRKTAISLDEAELLELERIVTGGEEKEALVFLKKSVYEKVKRSQKGKLKSHLDTGGEIQKGPLVLGGYALIPYAKRRLRRKA